MKYPGFIGPTYTSQSRIAADDRCVNWYPEKIESGTGKSGYALYPTPGYVPYVLLPDYPGRGLLSMGLFATTGLLAAVSGSTLFTFFGVTPTARGTIANDSANHRVSMVTNGDAGGQMLISSGLGTHTLYSYNLTTGALTTLTPQGSVVGFLDGYGLALDTDTSTLQWSAPEDFTSWDPLDVAQRNDAPDRWLGMLVNHKEIWLFGSDTTSIYYDSGSDPVFQPISSAFLNYGIVAPLTARVVNGSPVWLGKQSNGAGVVYRASGYTPEKISTFAVDYAIAQLGNSDLSNAYADVFTWSGHTFYKLSFPGPQTAPNTTFIYDDTTGLWFEEGEWDGQIYTGLSTWGQAFVTPNNLTLSRTSGQLFALTMAAQDLVGGLGPPSGYAYPAGTDLTVPRIGHDAAGNLIRRLRRAPHVNSERKRVIIDRFEIDMEVGIANASGVGSDPHVAVRWSKDGGQTFGNSVSVSAGKIGEYRQRVITRRLGQGRDWVFEIAVTDPIPQRLVDAYLDLRVGAS